MNWLPVFAILLGLTAAAHQRIALPSEDEFPDPLEEQLVEGLEDYIQTGVQSESLKDAFEQLAAPQVFRSAFSDAKQTAICLVCNALTRIIISYRQSGASKEKLTYIANAVCVFAQIENKHVCEGVIGLNIDTFLYIADSKPDLSPSQVCGILGQSLGCKAPTRSIENDWSIRINPGPKIYPRKSNNSKANQMRILHFTDIHYDELYTPGANAVCDDPLCCGNNQGLPKHPKDGAGNWGDYRNCDTPWHSVLDLMNEVKKKKFDYVYYTGDVINHRVWATNQENNIKNLKKMFDQFKITFGDTPVYPIIGNHEPNPLDLFAPTNITEPQFSTQWLFNTVAEKWAYWLPESALETVRKGGYYTVLVKPGFRIVALNSNVAYTFNWWLLYDDTDPYGQLQWLANVLLKSEQAGEIVHIISHVPTGDNTCLIKWTHEYLRIIERFHHIIGVQINGHTHNDEFTLFYSQENSDEAISVAYNGGSVTTYNNLNPNYRIYTVNPENYKIEDYDQWIFNMTEANLHSVDTPPVWYKHYSFKEAYEVKNMTDYKEIEKVISNIALYEEWATKYWIFKVREADAALSLGCDRKCREEDLCRLVTTEHGNDKKCNELLGLRKKKNNFFKKIQSSILNFKL